MAVQFREDRPSVRHWLLPIGSTIIGSMLSLCPIIVEAPAWPSFGLLMALAWRLWRPEMWGAWIALLLGLADDLITGSALGSAAALWTFCFLMLDIADHRRLWRDPLVDWQLAATAILTCSSGAWAFAKLSGGAGPFWTVGVQAFLGIMLYPAAARLCASLDRWRLGGSAANSF